MFERGWSREWSATVAVHLAACVPPLLTHFTNVVGTLALAESQDPRIPAQAASPRDRHRASPSRKLPKTRKMATSGLTSVLSLYRGSGLRHILEVILVEEVLRRASLLCLHRLSTATSTSETWRAALAFVLWSTILAPLRLLATELVLFRRGDWRFFQLNEKMLPIYLPTLASAIWAVVAFRFCPDTVAVVARLLRSTSAGVPCSWYRVAWTIASAAAPNLAAFLVAGYLESFRVRAEVLVLNSHGNNDTIVPVDEAYSDSVSDILLATDYSITDALRRYTWLCGMPRFVHTAARVVAQIVKRTKLAIR